MYYVDRKEAVGSIKGFDNNVCLETFLDASLCGGGKSVTIGADHPADRTIFSPKALNRFLTYTHELPMGIASQNRFWLFKRLPSCEDSDLQFLGH